MKYFFIIIACLLSGWAVYSGSGITVSNIDSAKTISIKGSDVHPELVWSDEFNYEGNPKEEYWSYDVGDGCNLGCGCGWGNQELQYYTEKNLKNVRVENGNLVIALHIDDKDRISSGRIHTKGKHQWNEATVEIRAKTAKGLGTWSAAWMLPSTDVYGGWPKSGEIDIMEQVGYQPDSIWSAAHVEKYNHIIGTHKNGGLEVTDVSDDFHIYKLVWTADEYTVFIDDKKIFTFENEKSGPAVWPFDQDFYMIFNLAYGGNWGGKHGIDKEALPTEMLVDYVRVYQ